MNTSRPLLACYGGGHAQIVASLARGLERRGVIPTVVGFTTAYQELLRQDIAAVSVEALLEPENDASYLRSAEAFVGGSSHPDITPDQTRAYFALGLRDLVARIGWTSALERVRENGRKAFEPVSIMRRYLRKNRPDIVITTTSPRFELALLKAARQEGIPTLAVGDLFLVKERDWILQDGYAQNLAVLSAEVACSLVTDGFPEESIRVTGNPAFDSLALALGDAQRRRELRTRFGMKGKTVVLWPAAGGERCQNGRSFLTPEAFSAAIEPVCREDASLAYLMRSHPNRPFDLPKGAQHGQLDDGNELSAEDAILISDVVCVEASTMGLQAALFGKPVICIGYADYVLYPEYGLARATATLSEAMSFIRSTSGPTPARFGMPELGTATNNVLRYIEDILSACNEGSGVFQ